MAHGVSPWTSTLGIHIPTNGNVGIGTTTPSEKLDVVGNIEVTGSIDASDNINAGPSVYVQ